MNAVTLNLLLLAVVLGLGLVSLPSAHGQAADFCTRIEDLDHRRGDDGATYFYLDQNLNLCPRSGPVVGTRIVVNRSNVTLECNGVVFDGLLGPDSSVAKWAFTVARGDQDGKPVSNVTISGCRFQNYDRGIVLGTGRKIAEMRPELGLQGFAVRNTSVYGTAKEGLIVGPYNTDTLLDGLVVKDAFLSGVYLEAYSQRTTIRNSRFINNGFSASSEGREGIAIDASSYNTIVDNEFINNRYAGIATYKNCGESEDRTNNLPGTPRNMHANHNLIARNIFKYHDNPSGAGAVVLASRQGARFPDNLGCTDVPGSGERYYDYSKYNLVKNNSFINNITSIKIADSFNQIRGNTFTGTSWTNPYTGERHRSTYDVAIGSSFLRDEGRPVHHVQIVDNVTRTSTTNTSGRTFVPLHGSSVAFSENTDRYYRCISNALAPGNTCTPGLPKNRCEVSASACPAHTSWPNFANFPSYFLDTCYGSNILPEVCAQRARDLWQWCASSGGTNFSVTTTAVQDGVSVLESTYNGD